MIIDITTADLAAAHHVAHQIGVTASLEGHRVTIMEGRRIVRSLTPNPRGRDFESITINVSGLEMVS
ncbi:hypothetical protein [Sphingopyxis sp. GW247-27LB]|uniref:hypothetical protein n=1 Tax=Sphingopyxis sp. GW247-27LB TaxID=2012632 RepID=UPI000BA722DD|nr:hypothetical protein [Sphingopyxis sp. GW247-27LB]PAL23563.1 hypothetical protein CD928_05715 [Sphingopyxis sp. GW247-27LB]